MKKTRPERFAYFVCSGSYDFYLTKDDQRITRSAQNGAGPLSWLEVIELAKLLLPLLVGTNRKERNSIHPARWLLAEMQKRAEIETRLFDVADFALPQDDYGQGLKDRFPEWRDTIINADGLVIVTPEYNHGYPGALKAVLDLLLKEYIHKPVALVGVSAGPWGGTRVIEAMVPMVRELGLAVTFNDLNFPKVQRTFDAEGKLLDLAFEKRAADFLDELVWMATTLQWGRENVPSKHH
jgi:NAD(P)H-dependent FMN reductase